MSPMHFVWSQLTIWSHRISKPTKTLYVAVIEQRGVRVDVIDDCAIDAD